MREELITRSVLLKAAIATGKNQVQLMIIAVTAAAAANITPESVRMDRVFELI